MPSHCLNLALHTARLSRAQREFFFAWKALEAHKEGDASNKRQLFENAMRAFRALELAHKQVIETIWDQRNPRSLAYMERKHDYTRENSIDTGTSTETLQALPDGRIVSGGRDNTIRIWNGEAVEHEVS